VSQILKMERPFNCGNKHKVKLVQRSYSNHEYKIGISRLRNKTLQLQQIELAIPKLLAFSNFVF